MLDEGERRRAVIEIPGEAAVVEIDDLGLCRRRSSDWQAACRNERGRNAAVLCRKSPAASPIRSTTREKSAVFSWSSPMPVSPRAPMRFRPEGAFEIPGKSLEIWRRTPAARESMHLRRHEAQGFEWPQQFMLGRLGPFLPGEKHDLARLHPLDADGLNKFAVGTGQWHWRDHRTSRPQRFDPGEFRGDRVSRVIALTMDSHGESGGRQAESIL